MDVKLPDGRVLQGVPDGTTKAQLVEKLRANGMDVPQEWLADSAPAPVSSQANAPFYGTGADNMARYYFDRVTDETTTPKVLGGVGETALHLGTSMAAAPLAGIAGLFTLPATHRGHYYDVGTQDINDVQQALTYQPRTVVGKVLSGATDSAFQGVDKLTDVPGSKVAEVTGSPLAGSAVKTGLNLIPALLMRGRGGKAVAGGEAGAAAETAAQSAARAYVTRAGVDWNTLAEPVKARLTAIAGDARNLDKLDPQAVAREGLLAGLPVKVPATRGQLTRDPVQLRNEGNVSATKAGQPIREVYEAQNQALLDNLELLKGRQRGKATTNEQVGLNAQTALRTKLEAKKREVSQLYEIAEKTGELQGRVSPKGVIDVIESSPDETHFGWVDSWLTKMNVREKGAINKLTLKQMEDLRQAAVARAMNGGTDAYYAGKVIRAIDQATEGAGGKAYKAARQARREQAMEFEDQASVARLVDDKSRTDRAVALEDTWRKTVLGGSIDDLRKVQLSLLTGKDAKARAMGKQSWRDIRAQTIQYIYDEATKSVTRTEGGARNITPAAMDRAIKAIGEDKINLIFGPGTVKTLKNIMEATRIVKTEPPTGFKGSPSFANAIAFLERSLGKVPVLGDTATGAIRGVAAMRDLGKNSREAEAAVKSPLETAMTQYGREQTSKRYKNALGNSAPAAGSSGQN